MGSENGRRRAEMPITTMILTSSSGAATPNTERRASDSHGLSDTVSNAANGARASPSKEMLAAPSRNAVQTSFGGTGLSSVATKSHSTSKAGATAAVPM